MMKYNFLLIIAMPLLGNAQGKVGINTESPAQTLEVNGTFKVNALPNKDEKNSIYENAQATSKTKTFTPTKMVVVDDNGVFGKQELPVIATSSPDNPITKGQVLQWDGEKWVPATLQIPEQIDLETGSVISINGKISIAEEMTILMEDKTYSVPTNSNQTYQIPYLTDIQINNKRKFVGNSTGNSFSVTETGYYQITMNIGFTSNGGSNVIGIWNESTNKWVARMTTTNSGTDVATLITVIQLTKDTKYSFRAATSGTFTIQGFNGGNTGKAAVSYVSVKRAR